MRISPFILALLLSGDSLLAQQQEKRMEERILGKPDEHMQFNLHKSSGVGGRSVNTRNASVKNFYVPQKYNSKGYQTGEFNGSKDSWLSKFKFGTKSKDTSAFRDGDKAAGVKEMPTREANEAGKTAANRELHDANRTYLGKERAKLNLTPDETSQRSFARSQLVELKSIDDIRELLNKSK